jgi:hypothetical protein
MVPEARIVRWRSRIYIVCIGVHLGSKDWAEEGGYDPEVFHKCVGERGPISSHHRSHYLLT